ncbi:hypothetical protein SNEBB_008363 [Seison nebaliae]|nr:hypothetical protein SNEBB_008363 [Seison nebaliae]
MSIENDCRSFIVDAVQHYCNRKENNGIPQDSSKKLLNEEIEKKIRVACQICEAKLNEEFSDQNANLPNWHQHLKERFIGILYSQNRYNINNRLDSMNISDEPNEQLVNQETLRRERRISPSKISKEEQRRNCKKQLNIQRELKERKKNIEEFSSPTNFNTLQLNLNRMSDELKSSIGCKLLRRDLQFTPLLLYLFNGKYYFPKEFDVNHFSPLLNDQLMKLLCLRGQNITRLYFNRFENYFPSLPEINVLREHISLPKEWINRRRLHPNRNINRRTKAKAQRTATTTATTPLVTNDVLHHKHILWISEYCRFLTSVDLTACYNAVDDDTMQLVVGRLRFLEELSVAFCYKLTDRFVYYLVFWLGALTEQKFTLEYFHSDRQLNESESCRLRKRDNLFVYKLHPLKLLNISGTNITDEGLRYIASGIYFLQTIYFDYCPKITNVGVELLAREGRHIKNISCCGSMNLDGAFLNELLRQKNESLNDIDWESNKSFLLEEECDKLKKRYNVEYQFDDSQSFSESDRQLLIRRLLSQIKVRHSPIPSVQRLQGIRYTYYI